MFLFSTKGCNQCKRVENLLKKAGMQFEKIDLKTADGLSRLRCMQIFELQAPILVFSEDPLRYMDAGHIAASSDQTILDVIR